MSEQTQACEGFNNKSGDKHQLANLLVFLASVSMLHLYRAAILWPLSDPPLPPSPPFFFFFPSRILQIFRGSSLLICSTDRKRGGSRRAAPSVWGQSIQGKELQTSSCSVMHRCFIQKQTEAFLFLPRQRH